MKFKYIQVTAKDRISQLIIVGIVFCISDLEKTNAIMFNLKYQYVPHEAVAEVSNIVNL